MKHLNVEIKAQSRNQDEIRTILLSCNAIFQGTDQQIDTYFNAPHGKLKLREGNIENYLIQYKRDVSDHPKQSNILLYETQQKTSPLLKQILTTALGILVTVDKTREIYFIDNVKFHLDHVKDLGTFIEIEAISENGSMAKETLRKQCQYYIRQLKISSQDLLSQSYSDLLLQKKK